MIWADATIILTLYFLIVVTSSRTITQFKVHNHKTGTSNKIKDRRKFSSTTSLHSSGSLPSPSEEIIIYFINLNALV